MSDAIEPDERRYAYSKPRLALMFPFALAAAGGCGYMAYQGLSTEPVTNSRVAFAVVFVIAAAVCLFSASLTTWRLGTSQGDVLILTRYGVTDRRVSSQEIPWRAIREVRSVRRSRQDFLYLVVKPQDLAGFPLTRLAAFAIKTDSLTGDGGFVVNHMELGVSFDSLMRKTVSLWEAGRDLQRRE
jgi:hypothetical protein